MEFTFAIQTAIKINLAWAFYYDFRWTVQDLPEQAISQRERILD